MSLLNLKEILASDSVTEKLDKINYNFDILINTSGPIGNTGATGSDGNIGTIGITGQPGNSGEQGPSGSIGTSGTSEWITNQYTNSNNNSTYILSPDYVAGNKTSTIVIGHPDINSESYNSVFDKSQLTIFNNSEYDSNIRLVTQGSEDFFDINFNTSNELELGFNQGASGYTLKLEASSLSFSDLLNNTIINADTSQISFNKNTYFVNSSVTIDSGLKLDFGSPSANKIACSNDDNGNIAWKSLSEIVDAIPIGMIVPVLHSVLFDDANFIKTQPNNWTTSSATKIQLGRGVTGTPYEGWYLCNGRTWVSDDGTTSISTPDLNSSLLNLNLNEGWPDNDDPTDNDGQFQIFDLSGAGIVSNLAHSGRYPGIVGSSTIRSYSSTHSIFDMEAYGSNISDDIDIVAGNTTISYHNRYSISKVPHIIYLGVDNLTWSDNGMIPIRFHGGQCSTLTEGGTHNTVLGYVWRHANIALNYIELIDGVGYFNSAGWNDNFSDIADTIDTDTNKHKIYADANAQSFLGAGTDVKVYRNESKNGFKISNGKYNGTFNDGGTACP